MQPKFTLKKRGVFYLLSPLLSLFFLILAGTITAQQYINGNLTTGATSSNGIAAPAGFTWSEVQAGNTTAGYGANISGFTVADNFTISCGNWGVTKMTFFAYSTGYAGASSPFNDVRVRIFDTDPSVGSPAPIFGDLTTNRFLASSTASMYRIFNASPGTTRQVWKIEATVNVTLGPGTYWVEWGVNNTTPLVSNFTPASTIVGSTTQPGNNAKQHTLSDNTWANVNDGASPQDFHFIIDYSDAVCTGTPAPGNTLSTAANVCPATSFSLSLQNCIPGTGVTYQWQSSTDGGTTWNNIAGATSATLLRTQTVSTSYRCNVTCSGNTGTSVELLVPMAPSSACYCIPPATNCDLDDVITNVKLGTLNNSSACSANGYNFYNTVTVPELYAGTANPISVTVGPGGTENVAVWVDWNQNGQFEPSEFSAIGSGNGVTINGAVNVASGATLGQTRMRVRVRFSTALTGGNACTGYTYGETEDYLVNIVPCVPVTITTPPANKTVVCGGNTSFTVAASGSLPVYAWEYRTSAAGVWQNVTNTGIYSGANTSTLTLTNVIADYNGYQYRALVSGGCSAVDFSSVATLTVNAVQPTVNPTSASICLGATQRIALTNLVSTATSTSFTSGTVSITIPENETGASFGTSTISVSGIPAGSVITGVKATLNMTHSYVGDVCYVLKAPNGDVLNLDFFKSGTGGSGINFVNTAISSAGTALLSSGTSPFTGTFRADAQGASVPSGFPPSGPVGYTPTVTTWNGLYSTPNGNWTLAFFDYYVDPDPGTFTKWDLEITYVAPVYAQGTWNGPAGTIFTDAAATVPYTGTLEDTVYVKPIVAGVNNYTVFFTTPAPCITATANIPIAVAAPLTALTVTPATRSVCVGGSTTFSSTVTGGTNVTYQWQRSTDGGLTWNNISGETGASLTVVGSGINMTGYRYRVVASSGACSSFTSTNYGALTVNALPNVTISTPRANVIPGVNTTVTATSTPAAAATNSWSWTLNGAAISGTSNAQTVSVDQLGTYQATVTDVNGCVNTSNQLVIGAEASDKLWIYPNPTPGAFQVRLYFAGNSAEKRVVSIFNPNGQLVTSRTIDLSYRSAPYQGMNFDFSGMARGTYVVKVAHEYGGSIVSGLVLVQ